MISLKPACFFSVFASLCFGLAPSRADDYFKPFTKIDPTNKNSDVSKATGHVLDPSVLFPKVAPTPESELKDSRPGNMTLDYVNYSIDPQTGQVSSSSHLHPQWHQIGLRAQATVKNGQRVWLYSGITQPIPPNVNNDGMTEQYDGTQIIIQNHTNAVLGFKGAFESASNPGTYHSFTKNHVLAPGEKGIWFLPPSEGVAANNSNGRWSYRLRIEGVNPNTGQKLDEWGPNPNRPGLIPNEAGRIAENRNGLLHVWKGLYFDLTP